MATTYTYTEATSPNIQAIEAGVAASAMTNKSIEYGSWDSDTQNLDLVFTTSLIAADKTLLDAIVEDKAGDARIPLGAGGDKNIITITGNYQAGSKDGVILADAKDGNIIIKIPDATGIKRTEITIKRIDSSGNTVTLQTAAMQLQNYSGIDLQDQGGVDIFSTGSDKLIDNQLTKSLASMECVTLKSDDLDWWIISN